MDELDRDLKRTILMIALLSDAAEKYGKTIKTLDTNLGVSPRAIKSAEDIEYLRKKKRYLEFLIVKKCE